MARTTRVTKSGRIFIPQDTLKPNWKIVVGGTDYSDRTIISRVIRPVTDSVGYVNTVLDNSKGEIVGDINYGDEIKIYADYSNGSNQIFAGYVDIPYGSVSRWRGRRITLVGRDYGVQLLDRHVTGSYSDQTGDTIVKDLVDKFAPSGFTYNNVEATTSTMSITWQEENFWEALRYVCRELGLDCYIDFNKDIHLFEKGSRLNSTDAVVVKQNLLATSRVGYDGRNVKNFVRVYGRGIDGSPQFRTVQASSFSPWKKEKIERDTSLTNQSDVLAKANKIYDDKSSAEFVGAVKSVGLPGVLPGEKVRIADPYSGFSDDRYRVVTCEHHFWKPTWTNARRGGYTSKLFINQEINDVAGHMANNQNVTLRLRSLDNKNNFTDTFSLPFDSQSDELSSISHLLVQNGLLQLDTGRTSGTAVSKNRIATDDLSSFLIYAKGWDLDSSKFYVSVDNGVYFQEVSQYASSPITPDKTGKFLQLKAKLISDSDNLNPSLQSLTIAYK